MHFAKDTEEKRIYKIYIIQTSYNISSDNGQLPHIGYSGQPWAIQHLLFTYTLSFVIIVVRHFFVYAKAKREKRERERERVKIPYRNGRTH